MAVLIRPRRGQPKPAPGAAIDYGHPLAAQMMVCILFSEGGGYGWERRTGRQWATGGNAPLWVPDGVQFSGAANDRIEVLWGETGLVNATVPNLSLDGLIRITGTSNNGEYVKFGRGVDTERGIGFGVGNTDFDGAGANLIALNDNVAWMTPSPAAAVPYDRWAHAALTYDAGAWKLYLEGRLVGSGSVSAYNGGATTRYVTVGGNQAPSAARVPNGGRVATARMWTRTLTGAEVVWLAAEPYAFVTPPAPRVLFFADLPGTPVTNVTGTAAITLPAPIEVAASGTLTITGTAAITLPGLTVAASGTETISGTSAVTLPALTVAATGTETITGTAAATLPALTVAASGTETFTGTSAVTLPALTTAGTGTVANPITGTAALTLAALTADATGTVTNPSSPGTITATFAPTGLTTGTFAPTGTTTGVQGP